MTTFTSLALVSVIGLAAPAMAVPYDATDIDFGPASWGVNVNNFKLETISLLPQGLLGYELTSVWDDVARTDINSDSLFLDGGVACAAPEDIDVQVEAESGDLVYTCASTYRDDYDTANLDVISEIRVLDGGQLLRFATLITNTGLTEAAIDGVTVTSEFGSLAWLYDYQNQSDEVLEVFADESVDHRDALNSVDSQWVVHGDEMNAPGGFIIGGGDAELTARWNRADFATYRGEVGPFTIPAGESRYIVTFGVLALQPLIDGGYDQDRPEAELESMLTESADLIVARMSEFDAGLTDELSRGLDGAVPVLNWGSAPEAPGAAPELAETGAVETTSVALGALAVLGIGAMLLVRRRARA